MLKLVSAEGDTLSALQGLYMEAFPAAERKPFEMLLKLRDEGKMELLAIMEDGEFAGLDINLYRDGKSEYAILDYYAICPEKRGGGIGSRALQLILERFCGRKLIFEIERENPEAENAGERSRRKRFYLRNGLKETGIELNVYGTDFELLTQDGILSYEEYFQVFREVFGEAVLQYINPVRLS